MNYLYIFQKDSATVERGVGIIRADRHLAKEYVKKREDKQEVKNEKKYKLLVI